MRHRFEFQATCIRSADVCEAQMRENIGAGWPLLEEREPHATPLAVVGGGPSAGQHLEELKEWRGDIWAINQSAAWLTHCAPKANVYLFTVDPDEAIAEPIFTAGVQRAILSSACHPSLYRALRGKYVRMFHCRLLEDLPMMCLGGGRCSASRAVLQAAWQGYMSVTFFGCEGSLGGEVLKDGTFVPVTHAYRQEHRANQFVVRAGGREYVTTPDLYMNTQDLVRDFTEYRNPDAASPYGLKEKSGGLLRAMLEYPDEWAVVALSTTMRDRLDPDATQRYIPQRVAA